LLKENDERTKKARLAMVSGLFRCNPMRLYSNFSTKKTQQENDFSEIGELFSPEEIEDLFGDRLLLYVQDDGNLYQTEPHFGSKDQEGSFTNSISSYIKQASRCVSECLESQVKPRVYVVVRIDDILTAQDHNQKWKRISRRLRESKIVCLWVRECTRQNKLHYNFLVSSNQSETEIDHAIRYAFEGMRINLGLKPCGDSFEDRKRLFNYVFKARVECIMWEGPRKGEPTSDLYAKKRVLFKKNSPLRKHGCIGQFYGDRKSLKEKLRRKAKENSTKRNEERFLLEQATIQEQAQAKYEFQIWQTVPSWNKKGWRNANQILLSLVQSRLNETTKAKP